MTTEKRRLSLHPLAIHTFIQAQAGSLAKALSESVMNSFDAFATAVNVNITRHGFEVSDDGQGFRDKDEIAAWFETLGFPHDEGNHRTWGQFGMGRAQAWAFASTVWTSNTFEMSVDVKRNGLDYDLRMLPLKHPGTRIVGKLYTPMNDAEVVRVEMELRSLIRYVPWSVTINGKLASADPSLKEWPMETDDAWMDLTAKRSGNLEVYNAGVLVNSYGAWQYGCAGVIVTKPDRTLRLNLARNAILEAECPVWKRIRGAMPKAESNKTKPAKEKLSHYKQESLVKQFTDGEIDLAALLQQMPNALTDVYGRVVPFDKLAGYRMGLPVTVLPKGDESGKRLNKLRMAVVLSEESLGALGLTLEQLKERVVAAYGTKLTALGMGKTHWEASIEGVVNRGWLEDPKEHFSAFYAGRSVTPITELEPKGKAAYRAWSQSMSLIAANLGDVAETAELRDKCWKVRCFSTGDSPAEELWLEGGHTLVIRTKELVAGMARHYGSVSKFALRQIHLLCRELASSPAEGDALFVRATTQTPMVGEFIPEIVRRYAALCKEYDVELEEPTLKSLDVACAA